MQDASWPPAVVCEPSLKDDWVLFISLDRHSSKSFCFLNGEVLFPKSTTDASTNTSDEKLPTNVNNFVFTCGATGINFTSPSCCFGHFYCWIVQPTSTPSWRGHFTLTFGICALRCALHFSQFERYIGRHLLLHKSLVTNANFAWLPSTKQQLWRLSQNDSAVKIKQDFLGVIFCCPMEIVPPQMKIQCDRCVIFHSVSSSLSVASLSCLFAVETSLYLLLKHVPVDPFISFSFIHSSLTLLKGKKVNFAYYKLKGTVSQGFCSRLIPLKSQ